MYFLCRADLDLFETLLKVAEYTDLGISRLVAHERKVSHL